MNQKIQKYKQRTKSVSTLNPLFATVCLLLVTFFFLLGYIVVDSKAEASDNYKRKRIETPLLGKSNSSLPQIQKILADDGDEGDYFGLAVAMSEDTAVFGAYNADVGTNDRQGAAYVYVKSNNQWNLQQKLTASDGAFNDSFGISVAISGDIVVVGAIGDNLTNPGFNHGSAYIFKRTGSVWSQEQKILPSDISSEKEFGFSVAVFGNTVFASARNAVDDYHHSTYVFGYDGNSWTQMQKLLPSDSQTSDSFGFRMELFEDFAFIGATSGGKPRTGAVYYFTKNNDVWSEEQIILADDGLEDDNLGTSLTFYDDTLYIAAGGDDVGKINNRGSIYLFERNNNEWVQTQQIINPTELGNENFGRSIAVSDNLMFVGANSADVGENSDQGVIYLFEKIGDTWTEGGKIVAEDGTANDNFGIEVEVANGNLITGAYTDVINGNANQGSAYIFTTNNNSNATTFDFDGDSKTDVSIFRPDAGQWWYLKSSDLSSAAFAFGTSSDTLVPADYTGDGKTDIAFWRESTGEWFILRSEDSSFFGFPFGTSGDIPAPGDFDGDGIADAAVYRPSSSTWFIQRSSDGGTTIQGFGIPEDKPTVADFDGDGKDDIAIFRPSVSQWWQLRSQDGVIAYQFGTSGDKTIQGDYTGDGKADVGVFRPSTGQWLILRSEDSSFFGFPFGISKDIPIPGDYDGDGKFDAAVLRPSTNTWFYNGSTSGNVQLNFGIAGDVPIPNVYSVE